MRRLVLAGCLAWVGLLLGGAVAAQTTLTGLKQAKFRRSTTSETRDTALIKFTNDPALLLLSDPTCSGQALSEVQITTSNQVGPVISLPCAGWSLTGRGYRYRDKTGAAGGVRTIKYEFGKLSILMKGPTYAEISGPLFYANVSFRVGSTVVCGQVTDFTRNETSIVVSRGPSHTCIAPSPTPSITQTGTPTATPTRTPIPICGDGIRQGAEECDDGNALDGDCCWTNCQFGIAGTACASDGNPCTDDQCDGSGTCEHLANSAPCDDGSLCTQNDTCAQGACAGALVKPWINEVNYDGYDVLVPIRDHEEFVEIAGPAGVDLGGYRLLAVEGAGNGSLFQPCLSGSLSPGQAYFTATIPAGTVIHDDTGKGTGFVVLCLQNTSGDIQASLACDVVLSGMPSSDSNLPEGAVSNLWDCADGVLLLNAANQLVDAVSYEGHVANQGPYGALFVGAPDIGRDWGLVTDTRRSLVKTTDTLQREQDGSNWGYTGNNGDSPGAPNGQQGLSCYHAPGYTHTRYPIVLVHGLYGFDSLFGVVDYWNGIVEALTDGGATVYVAQVSQLNTPQARGAQLIPQIEALLVATGASKVNLIGHSQGAVDIRYVAAVRPDLIASVTSIAGPHKGAELADFLRDNFQDGSFTEDVVAALGNTLGDLLALLSGSTNPNDAIPAIESLTSTHMAQFNAAYPQGVPTSTCGEGAPIVNGIYYFSWTGTAISTHPLDPSDSLFEVTTFFYSEPNDGLVGRCSSHLGDVIRDNYFHNHIDEVNLLFGLVWPFEVNPKSVFRAHANRLKNLNL